MVRKEVRFRDIIAAAYERKEEGNRAARRGDWDMASRLWVRAVDVVRDGTRYHADVVAAATREEGREVDGLYVSVELNIILARLKRKDWRSAVENVQVLFRYYGEKMDGGMRAKAYYRKGLAYVGLRIEDDAMWCFRKGLELVPGDEDCKREVERLEEKKRERERKKRAEEELERKAKEAEEEARKVVEREKREKRDRMKKVGKRLRRGKKSDVGKKGAQETVEG